jgi:hypothetical protein
MPGARPSRRYAGILLFFLLQRLQPSACREPGANGEFMTDASLASGVMLQAISSRSDCGFVQGRANLSR